MGTKHIPATPAFRWSALSPVGALFRRGRYTLAGASVLCCVVCLLYFFSPLTLAAQDLPVPSVDSAVSLGFTQSPPQEEKASPVTSPTPTPPLSENTPTPSPAPLTPEQPTAPLATTPQDTSLAQEQRADVPAPTLQEPSPTPLTQESPVSLTQETTAPRTDELSPAPLTEPQPTPAPLAPIAPLAVVEQRLPPMPDEVEQRLPATVPDTTPDTPSPAPANTPAASPAKAAAASKDNKRLFGTIEMRASTKELRQWQDVQKRHVDNPVFVPGFKLNASTSWDKLKSMLQDKPALEKIRGVNSFWNQWPYKLDKSVYGKEDYWAAPYEFRKNSGDCEDYAITKYYTLKELGIPVEQMRIVVLKDTILNVAHAVLAVYLDDDIYILDNIAKNVLSHTRIRNYLPVYSVNEQYRWVHMRTSK